MAERRIEYGDDGEPAWANEGDHSWFEPPAPTHSTEQASAVRRRSSSIRRELSARNLARAEAYAHETTFGSVASVVYMATDDGRHGNFFPGSYRRILNKPAWSARLQKAYTASARVPRGGERQRQELDCANSSDALLMNIFCHPTALRGAGLRKLLGLQAVAAPQFGLRARLPLLGGHDDRTEFDMVLDDGDGKLLVEAKLSESDFQTAVPALLERYGEFESTFAVETLPRSRGRLRSYQLLRCVLAARHMDARFTVMLDARRTDLLEDVFLVYRAVQDAGLRSRLHVITWQEIAACVPRTLQMFLGQKYGIEAVRQVCRRTDRVD